MRSLDIEYSNTARRLGMVSAVAVVGFSLIYVVVLGLGFASRISPDQPIGDPWFSILEILIIAMMPGMVALMAAVHARTPAPARVLSLISLIFMSMVAMLTVSVHFSILVLGRLPILAVEPLGPLLVSFQWPSLPYAIDIVAWDVFFALSVLFAAPVFGGTRLEAAVRVLMIVSGALALAGLGGVVGGDMDLRNIGIAGYAVVFPAAAALLAVLFWRDSART